MQDHVAKIRLLANGRFGPTRRGWQVKMSKLRRVGGSGQLSMFRADVGDSRLWFLSARL